MDSKSRIVYASFFFDCMNLHITKEVGMLPYVLHRDYGYDTSIICYRNGEYPNLEKETPGLGIIFMPRAAYRIANALKSIFGVHSGTIEAVCVFLDVAPIILLRGRSIDVLQINHLKNQSILAGWLYKLVNPKGVLYMKLDLDPGEVPPDLSRRERWSILRRRLPVDIMSIETREPLEYMKTGHPFFKLFNDRLVYVPNGFEARDARPIPMASREKWILHVGRIGTYQKDSEIALETFARVAGDFPEWKLLLIGSMEEEFKRHYDRFIETHRDIADRILYEGFVSDRERLHGYYRNARILAIPSRFESFGLVVTEAGMWGDVVLGSDIPSIRDMTDGGRIAWLCPPEDVECFTRSLRSMLSGEEEMSSRSAAMSEFIRQNFDWGYICGRLDGIIKTRLKEKGKSD